MVIIAVMVLVTGALSWVTAAYRQWQQVRWNRYGAALRRLESGLTDRELELLPLLERPDLTYVDIAVKLHVSPATIKVHAHHIGRKLDVAGRWQIVEAARERGFLLQLPHGQPNGSANLNPRLSSNPPEIE